MNSVKSVKKMPSEPLRGQSGQGFCRTNCLATFWISLSLPLLASTNAFAQSSVQPQTQPATQTQAATSSFSRPSKEFKYRKRFIAPSSDLNHRVDYASMPSRDALMLPTYEPSYGKTTGPNANRPALNYQPIHPDDPQEALKAHTESLNSKSSGIKPMANRAGLTPPLSPASQKLIPSSLTAEPAKVSSAAAEAGSVPNLSTAQIAHVKAQADALSKQGRLSEAQEVLTRNVQEHPKEPVLRAELSKVSLERARYFSKKGSAQQAASQARLAIAYGSAYSNSSESAYSLLSTNLTKAGIDPRSADARANLGANLLAQNSPIEAEIEYRQALKLKPNSADFYIGAGNAAQASGNKTSAKFDYQKALELQPDAQPALSKLGVLRYQMHDYIGANADLTRALVMNGQDTVAAQTLIDLWQRQVASRQSDAGSHLGLARAYQVTGDLDSAKKEYKTVVKLDPNHPNLPAARQSFKLALARREAYKSFDAAHSLETQGQLANAYQKASDAVELYPSDANFQAYKTQLSGQLQAAGMPVYAAQGQAMQALSNLVSQGSEQPPQASIAAASSAAAQALQAAQAPMAADNMYKPLSTDNHVTSMSGFLSSLRNFTMQQQAQNAVSESAASQTIAGIAGVPVSSAYGSGASGLAGFGASVLPGEGPASAALAGVPGFAPASPLPGVTPSSSLDQGQMLASSRSRGQVTASSALQSAAQALGNTQGGFFGNMATGYGANAAPAAAANGALAGGTTSAAAAPTSFGFGSMALGAAPSIAPTMIGGMGKAVGYLHNRNAQTQTQTTGNLTQTSPGSTNYGFTPSGNFATAQTMPTMTSQKTIIDNQLTGQNPGGSVATAQSMAEPNVPWPQPQALVQPSIVEPTAPLIAANPNDPTSIATAAALAPPIVPTAALPVAAVTAASAANDTNAGGAPLRSLIPPGAVKLYLTGVKAAKSEVLLQVSLRNDGPVPLKIPNGIKAIVRATGQPDLQAKISFDTHSVASGATASGTIRVPGKSLDPTADVVIPTGALTNGAIADIHLSVPISAK